MTIIRKREYLTVVAQLNATENMMTREEILEQAREDHPEATVVDEVREGWKKIGRQGQHNFGIYYPGDDNMYIVTYGPEVDFPEGWNGPAVPTGSGKFTLWAN